MKTLFIGGIKSGKSHLAETFVLNQSTRKPYYLATTELLDTEMRARIDVHRRRRGDRFLTLEEPVRLLRALDGCPGPVLIECVSMWLNNMLYHRFEEDAILRELAAVLALPIDIVFVHNEVGLGIIGDNPLVRQFVDLSGKAAQMLGADCDSVYFCSAGLKLQLK